MHVNSTAPDDVPDSETEPAFLLPAKEASRLCGISLATWHVNLSAGRIGPRPVKIGGAVRFRRADLVAWIQAGCPNRQVWDAEQTDQATTSRPRRVVG